MFRCRGNLKSVISLRHEQCPRGVQQERGRRATSNHDLLTARREPAIDRGASCTPTPLHRIEPNAC